MQLGLANEVRVHLPQVVHHLLMDLGPTEPQNLESVIEEVPHGSQGQLEVAV
jgi:hypothetical protein